ncbi:MAG TPA: hypothetical protein VHV51_00450 [Polyangiaceae bacterium]|nr:hypothetical protein [Polyangiaceae bacterium]
MIALSQSLPPPHRSPFNAHWLDQVRKTKPDFVLLGNSMVQTRFDEPTLRKLLHLRPVSVLGLIGTASSGWYLALKNVIVASDYHPRVLLFFREQELTEPRKWTHGSKGRHRVEQLSLAEEPLLARKLAPPPSEPIELLSWWRERLMPFERLHERSDLLVDFAGKSLSRLAYRKADERTRMRRINELFALGNLRSTDAASEPAVVPEPQVFGSVVAGSFLPDMLELAAANQIPLTFVRVRTRPAAAGVPKTRGEQRYDADLERYVRAHGAEFYDMHDTAWETLDMYAEGDHISSRLTRKYTELFVEHMGQIFH